MSQPLTKRYPTRGSLRGRQDAHTVLHRMAMDEERAARIRDLKDQRPDLTWSAIADKVGVTERSAIAWQTTGGIEYENAKKLAKVFKVNVDWLWSGSEPTTPDLMGSLNGDRSQLDRIEAKVDLLLRMVGGTIDPADFTEDIVRTFEALLGPADASDEPARDSEAATGGPSAAPPARAPGKQRTEQRRAG